MRVYTGYLNDDGSYSADQFERRTYFIESWDGISANGKVKISAKDVLKLASDDRKRYSLSQASANSQQTLAQ